MNIYLKLFAYFVVYSAMMSYYEEYIAARHIFFPGDYVMGRVEDFGKSKIYYMSKAAREFYTIVSYKSGDEMHTEKVLRDMDDIIGSQIVLVVNRKSKWAVRYKKCRVYDEHAYNQNSTAIFCAISLVSLIIIDIWFGKFQEVCPFLIIFMCIHYLSIPRIIQFRNSIWQLK